ncbi:MAG: hypothetical protein HQL38_12675 [Alphaproteobacteria bacterium]|nr:hypothetical protein [Alphaproteobacteria bacterium]MBF0393526.1 hypothetical protein [Alphaproteobacteria bacterium]
MNDLTRATQPHPSASDDFYAEALRQLARSQIPFLLGGTFAVSMLTGLTRATKDLDVFCRAGDFPRILEHFASQGYDTAVEDERWIGKVAQGDAVFDVIFNSTCAVTPVTESWFVEEWPAEVFGHRVRITPPTEMIWSKVFVQDRGRYDGADIAHVLLKRHDAIDWRRLLAYMDQYWEVLLIHLLNFRFVYPSERDAVPVWLMDELASRLARRSGLPPPRTRVCRGRMFSRADYRIDIAEWGFADVVGESGPPS